MSPRKRGKVDGAASPDAGGDRISALPDNALHHVLSFIPAEDAVRTCVLARRWQHLWKSATGLRIGFSHGGRPPTVESVAHFVDHLLLRKRDACLHTCLLRLRPRNSGGWLVNETSSLNLWIRHVVEREIRMLRLEIHHRYFTFHLDWPVSQHLKTLELISVVFHRDLEWCPIFKNLRTLFLNEWWCLDHDFFGLNIILKHSPVLEKLSLHLFTKGPQHKVEMIGRYNQMDRPATILKHLKEIEVKCDVVSEQVNNVLKFLGTFGIHFLFK